MEKKIPTHKRGSDLLRGTYFTKHKQDLQKFTNNAPLVKTISNTSPVKMYKMRSDDSQKSKSRISDSEKVKEKDKLKYEQRQKKKQKVEPVDSNGEHLDQVSIMKITVTPNKLKMRKSLTITEIADVEHDFNEEFKVIEFNENQNRDSKEVEDLKYQIKQLTIDRDRERNNVIEIEADIENKRKTIQMLNEAIAAEIANSPESQLYNYAQKMLLLDQEIRTQEKEHEDHLVLLAKERDKIHLKNQLMNHKLEKIRQEIHHLANLKENTEQGSNPYELMNAIQKISKEKNIIKEEYLIWKKKNSENYQTKAQSQKLFHQYCELFKKITIGKEVMQAEEFLAVRNNLTKKNQELERKKINLKDKKFANMVREKKILDIKNAIEKVNDKMKKLSSSKIDAEKELNSKNISSKMLEDDLFDQII